MKGILLIALGHENYIRMAVNLAASIRVSDKEVNICLVHDGRFSDLAGNEQSLFSKNIICPDAHCKTNGQEDCIKAKTRLYELTPYQQTLFLDVDMVWLLDKPVSELIDSLEGIDFTIMNTGPVEKCYWAEPDELRRVLGDETPMYVFYSELIYFEKGDKTKGFFKKVKQAFDKPIVDARTFGTSAMPDELAFIIASLQTGVLPHQDNWFPVYWHFRDKGKRHLQPYQLSKEFYAYSIGGNVTPEYAKAHYNNLTAHYCKAMGIKQPYQVRDKRSYIMERTKY
jgi:hypothetical protein